MEAMLPRPCVVKTEAALLDRERELSQLVDMVPSHVWRVTPYGKPTFFNGRMVDFLGLDVADTDKPGMTRLAAMIETVVHPDDAAPFHDTLDGCLVIGEPFSIRCRRSAWRPLLGGEQRNPRGDRRLLASVGRERGAMSTRDEIAFLVDANASMRIQVAHSRRSGSS